MEKSKFLLIYKRELDRVNRFDIELSAKEHQQAAYTFVGEYSEHRRLTHAIESIESTYNNCGADNLDFLDQITISEYIDSLKHMLTEYLVNPNSNYSLEIIEELITLVNLYLNMQILHYPAFIRLIKKGYFDKYLLSQSLEIDFEIPSIESTITTLEDLSLEEHNDKLPKDERETLMNRYEKEVKRFINFKEGKENVYKDIYEYYQEDSRIIKLVSNIKSIKRNLFNRIMKSNYEYEKKEGLIEYITSLEYAINNYQNYSPTVLEMMIEIANLLLNMEVKNPGAFEILLDNHYVEEYLLTDDGVVIRTFDETYDILKSFIKRI